MNCVITCWVEAMTNRRFLLAKVEIDRESAPVNTEAALKGPIDKYLPLFGEEMSFWKLRDAQDHTGT